MKWFRFYSEALHDSKVQTLSPDLFRAWVNILCLANTGQPRGRLPELKQIAFALRVKEEKAAQIMGQLTVCGLIDTDGDGRNLPHNWDERQPDSDDVNARVREHRKRKSRVAPADGVTLHATGKERDCNALDKKRGEENRNTHTPRASVGVPPDSDLEPFEAPLAPLPDAPNPCLLTDAERAELDQAAALAERLFPMAEFGGMLSREPKVIDGMDVMWWRPALQKLAERRDRGQRTWAYLLGILRGFHANGGPPEPAAVNGHRGPSKATERALRQHEAFERAIAEIPDPEGD